MFYLRMYHNASVDGRLFLAIVPDASTAARIIQLASVLKRAHRFSGKLIAPERLHISLFFLGGLPETMVHAACDALGELRAQPFRVSFDRTASFRGRSGSRPFVLIGDDGLNQLRSFRQALGAELARQGLKHRAKTNFEPHVTLLYDDRSVEEYPVAEPISWVINEFVLIHSFSGHAHLAKWRLRA
jgi:RNA 2',3'-cyclic 3'-phosphodiesterase